MPGDFCDGGIAQETDHLAGEVSRAVAFADQVIDLSENLFASAFGDGLHHLFEDVSGRGAHEVANGVGGNLSVGGGDGLIEDGERIAHGAVAGFGKQGESIVVGFDFFARNQVAQLRDDGVEFDGAKAEVLAA